MPTYANLSETKYWAGDAFNLIKPGNLEWGKKWLNIMIEEGLPPKLIWEALVDEGLDRHPYFRSWIRRNVKFRHRKVT
jgi:hypothetical protein